MSSFHAKDGWPSQRLMYERLALQPSLIGSYQQQKYSEAVMSLSKRWLLFERSHPPNIPLPNLRDSN